MGLEDRNRHTAEPSVLPPSGIQVCMYFCMFVSMYVYMYICTRVCIICMYLLYSMYVCTVRRSYMLASKMMDNLCGVYMHGPIQKYHRQ